MSDWRLGLCCGNGVMISCSMFMFPRSELLVVFALRHRGAHLSSAAIKKTRHQTRIVQRSPDHIHFHLTGEAEVVG